MTQETNTLRPKTLIGSQRNPDAYRPKPHIPIVVEPAVEDVPVAVNVPAAAPEKPIPKKPAYAPAAKIAIPKLRGKMSDDLEDEFAELFGEQKIDDLMINVDKVASQEILEAETKLKGKIVAIRGDDVFVEIGSREQGVVAGKMFKHEPIIGNEIDVIVLKHMPGEGLYEMAIPLAAADVRDWEQVAEGMILNAKIVKVNTGGYECEVNKLRGFIPMGQIALYYVEKPEEFIGQSFPCVVLEVNSMRRNLILSRKAMLEREREELRTKLLAELEEGQTREGVVRKIIDAGAFVDLGGVDGFVHISALSWGRVHHPKDVLTEGQRIKVKVTKMDLEHNRISLAYRDDAADPWKSIHDSFPESSAVRGRVTKIMDFGAFVELKPGLEGLVHISELSHKRVSNVSDVLKEGDFVDVMVVSIDPSSKRIGLSMKQLTADPEKLAEDTAEAAPLKMPQSRKVALRGGL